MQTDNPLILAKSALRAVVTAEPGYKLVVADFSAIEARILPWLAGEEWKVEAFRNIDSGTGVDIYKQAYAKCFNVDPIEVSLDQRQVGKILELACGYQGWVDSFRKAAHDAGLSISPDQAEELVKAWRRAHRNIVAFWKEVEQSAIDAFFYPGEAIACGDLIFKCEGDWLLIYLPSGRALHYYQPRVTTGPDKFGRVRSQLSAWGWNHYNQKWGRLDYYGGKLTNNIVQATARDILAEAMINAHTKGFNIVLTVHDEIVCEELEDDHVFGIKNLISTITQPAAWYADLPLSAEGYEAAHFRKG